MRRILFTSIAMLSALLAIVLWGMWARTWLSQDTVQRYGWVEEDRRFVSYGLGWSGGRLQGWFNALDANPGEMVTAEVVRGRFRSAPADHRNWSWSWFQWESESPRPVLAVGSWRVPGQYSSWSGGVRIWPVAAAASVLPGLWMWRLLRARRIRREGLCPKCQYDLRATPSRCPECGYEPMPA